MLGKGWGEWSQSERMQIKAFICLLGVFLLLLLVVVGLLHGGKEEEEPQPQQTEPESEVHIPVVKELRNIWIMEADESGLLCYIDGERRLLQAAPPDRGEESEGDGTEAPAPIWGSAAWLKSLREQVADLELTDGVVTKVTVKSEKISGRVRAADSEGVWLEGLDKLEFTEDMQGYRLYRELAPATYRDLRIGYDFADFCLEDGKVCAILLARDEVMENIRILLKTSDYQGIYHDWVELTCDTDFTIKILSSVNPQENIETYEAGKVLDLTAQRGARLLVEPTVSTGRIILQSVRRSQGIPAYRGSLELLWEKEGIVLINELPLEEYLYSVVPSEMPASYPQEALMAQAICARTYAYTHMQHAGYEALGAHVDDSTSYQVYNNILEQEAATTAVKATYGQLLMQADGVTLAETFYYSTSWGYGSDACVWKTGNADQYDYIVPRHLSREEMQRVLRQTADTSAEVSAEAVTPEKLTDEDVFAEAVRSVDPGDFEAGEGWYRWTYTVKTLQPDRIRQQLQSRYEAGDSLVLTQDGEDYVSSPIGSFREIRSLTIAARGVGGVADELLIETDRDTYKVISEHNIRYVLCDGETKVRRQDGSQVTMNTLLPSAFFTIEIAKDGDCVVGYNLTGGGFGHGVGMSQNGARAMAAEGYSASDILRFFYEGAIVQNWSEGDQS